HSHFATRTSARTSCAIVAIAAGACCRRNCANQEPPMLVNGVAIDDTFAEAFPMKATRLLITAHDVTWARHAAVSMTGFATSVIACGCEAGIQRELGPAETPD